MLEVERRLTDTWLARRTGHERRPAPPGLPISRRRCRPGATSSSPSAAPSSCANRAARRARRRRAAPRLDGDRRPQLVPLLRGARRALPRGRLRPSRPRPRHPLARSRSGSRTAPTTSSTSPTCSASSGSSPSATRWAGRSPSCSGAATPTRSTASCCARRRPSSRVAATSGSAFLGLTGLAAWPGSRPARPRVAHRAAVPPAQGDEWEPWAVRGVAPRLADGARGGRAIGTLLVRRWIGEIDVPDGDRHHDARQGRAAAPPDPRCSSRSPAPRRSASTAPTTSSSPTPTDSCRRCCGRSIAVDARRDRRRVALSAARRIAAERVRRRRRRRRTVARATRAGRNLELARLGARVGGDLRQRRPPASCSPRPSAGPSSTATASCAPPSRSPSGSAR